MTASIYGRAFATGVVCTSVTFWGIYSYRAHSTQPQHNLKEDISSQPSTLSHESKNVLKYGAPERGMNVRQYKNHALSYDRSKKIPLWVAEQITPADIEGLAKRKLSNFKMDPTILLMFSSQNSDFSRSGWSRGHMTPAGDNKGSQDSMDESFYLSNIVPQDINNNGNFWNRFEIFCRNLTKTYQDVWVVSGPLMLPSVGEDGKKYVKYQVIGQNDVAVPTHLFKLITVVLPADDETGNGDEFIALGAFVVPNQPIPSDHDLGQYQVPLRDLTRYAGLRFLPLLGDEQVAACQDLCEVTACRLMSQRSLQLHFTTRRMENATSVAQLEHGLRDLERRGVEPDAYLREVYGRKMTKLEEEEQRKEVRSDL